MDYKSFGLVAVMTCLQLQMEGVSSSSDAISVSPGCPENLAQVRHSHTDVHNDVCYLFVDDELFWKKARDKCFSLGGEMVSIDNQETMDYLAAKLDSKELGWNRKGVWIGMSYSGGTWRWTNGRTAKYENWAKDQPSRLFDVYSFEDCAQMRRDSGWKWHDKLCGSLKFHYNYICEFPLSKPANLEGYVNKPRGQCTNFSQTNGVNGSTPATTATRGSNSTHHRSRPTRSFATEQHELERTPLVSPSVSDCPLLGSGHARENTSRTSSAAPENQPDSMTNGPSLASSSGDYVDMNSLISRERQSQAEATAAKEKKDKEAPDEDKHTYTNVDHRAEKVENLYEVLP
ncbi:C-type lectin [Elysia marginata]|uniref:C-type lectin n=1 Tax=Elysia marginata TaxID=1093978 RepID=A0AAV4GGK2_9GAST|nr:C-type lectin [Elysia marginata]